MQKRVDGEKPTITTDQSLKDGAQLPKNSPHFGDVKTEQVAQDGKNEVNEMRFKMSKISQEDIQNRNTFEQIVDNQSIVSRANGVTPQT